MTIIKSIIITLFFVFLKPYLRLRYPSIWNLRKRMCSINNPFLYSLFLTIYTQRLKNQGSWIGSKSHIESEPIFPHGIFSIFISNGAKIGKNCIIFQQVTIGSNNLQDSKGKGAPCIGDNVLIGAGAKIIGNVKVGNNCRIGANAVVAKDIPDNTVVVPLVKIITKEDRLDNQFVYY